MTSVRLPKEPRVRSTLPLALRLLRSRKPSLPTRNLIAQPHADIFETANRPHIARALRDADGITDERVRLRKQRVQCTQINGHTTVSR